MVHTLAKEYNRKVIGAEDPTNQMHLWIILADQIFEMLHHGIQNKDDKDLKE